MYQHIKEAACARASNSLFLEQPRRCSYATALIVRRMLAARIKSYVLSNSKETSKTNNRD
jgi:hypothetical protein